MKQNSRTQLYSQSQKRLSSLDKYQPNDTMQNFKLEKLVQNNTSKHVQVLGLTDIQKIKYLSSMEIDEYQQKKAQEKLQLHNLSKNRINNWSDTIQAIRKQDDNKRFERFENDELKRRQIDIEEAIYQSEVKRKTLSKSNKLIYQAQDRVRAFQSKMMLSDAILERDQQIEFQGKLKQLEEVRNQVNHENELLLKEQQEEEYNKRRKILEEKKSENQRILQEQRDIMKINFMKRLQQEKIEDEVQKERNLENIKQDKLNQELKNEKYHLLQKEIKLDNKISLLMKDEIKKMEKEEQDQIEEFRLKKLKMEDIKKYRLQLKSQNLLAERQKLIDAQALKLQQIQNKQEIRLISQIKESEIKAEKEMHRKAELQKKLFERMDISAKQTLRNKEEKNQQMAIENYNHQIFWTENNKKLEEKERAEQMSALEAAQELHKFHKLQIEQRQAQRESQYLTELEQQERVKRLAENDEQDFQRWANNAITEWKQNGKTVYPLVKELHDYKKKTWID